MFQRGTPAVVGELDESELRVRSLSSAIHYVQARMRELNPEGRLPSEELIVDWPNLAAEAC